MPFSSASRHRTIVRHGLATASLCCAVTACSAAPQCDEAAMTLGLQVQAVASAIRDPGRADAMADVVALGTDSRYYTMVRGWLAQQLQGDLSILEASREGGNPAIAARVEFLRRAIRAIDLE